MVRKPKVSKMVKLAVLAFLCLWPVKFALAETPENAVARSLNNYEPDIEPYEDRQRPVRPIFNYRNNGVKIDIRVVPAVNDSTGDVDDRFPDFPTKDLGRCLFDLSISCARDRIARYIDTIANLNEITLFAPAIKFVKTRTPHKSNGERRMIDAGDGGLGKVDRSIDDFFDSFALRISLPRINGKKERNQIDFMFDDNGTVEGRGKKGGGGGGGGGKGGGKCKKMMMMMLMMGKMKLMAMAGMLGMKGMMMAGMSLMISKAMLIMKLMSLKGGGGGGGFGGGGGGGGGGGQLKEIVLLTKASAGASASASAGGGGPIDSYGAPPLSSYSPPSSGGGGYDYSGGGGGGWGRSFDNRISMSSAAYQPETVYTMNTSNFSKSLDIISPRQSNDDPVIKNSSAWNDTVLWDSWKSWNESNSLENSNQNSTDNNYNSKNNEFEAIRVRIPDVKDRIDRSGARGVRTIYAKKWKNYEAADRILNPGTPIVAMRRNSRGRTSKSIPIGVA